TAVNATVIPAGDSAYAGGNWGVICIDSNGCESELSNSVSVTLNGLPDTLTAQSNAPLCAGATLQLLTGNVVGGTYEWEGPNGWTSSSQNPSIFNADSTRAGGYRVRVTVNGCTSEWSPADTVVIYPKPTVAVQNDTLNCATGTTGLTIQATPNLGTAPFTFVWSGPGNYSSTLEDPIVPNATSADQGSYVLNMTDANGCVADPVTAVIAINDAPLTPTLSGSPALCAGDALTLNTSNYSGASVQYYWTTPTGPDTTSIPSLNINPVDSTWAGNYSVYAEVNGCTTLTSAATTVQVNAQPIAPQPSANYDALNCAGDTLFLTASGNPTHQYAWTGPNGFSATGANVIVPNAGPSANGSYTVSVTNGQCGATGSVVYNQINPIPASPTISAGAVLCEGDALNLTTVAYSGGSVAYIWNAPNGSDTTAVPSYGIGAVDTSHAGSYSVVGVVNGCASLASGNVNVVVHPLPAAPVISSNRDTLCEGDTLSFITANVQGDYFWSGPAGYSSNNQIPPALNGVTASNAGTYDLYLSVNGCTSPVTSDTIVVVARPATPTIQAAAAAICDGDSIGLSTSSGCSSFLWIGPGGGSANTLANPLLTTTTGNTVIPATDSAYASGDWAVVCVSALGCASLPSIPVNLQIAPQPSAPTLNNNGPVCAGDDLLVNGASGHPSAVFNWVGPNGFVSQSATNAVFNAAPADSGLYAAVVVVNGCVSDTAFTNAEVNEIPSAPVPTSNGPVCAGSQLDLFANVAADAYLWTGPDGFVSNQANPSIPGIDADNAGFYDLAVVVNGCTSAVANVNVQVIGVLTTPVLINNSPVCEGDTFALTTTPFAGTNVSYIWSGPGGVLDTTVTATYLDTMATLAENGFYSVTIQIAGCNSAASPPSLVTVNPIPAAPAILTDTSVCAGSPIQLVTNVLADVYLWTGPDGFVSTLQQPAVIQPADSIHAGNYSLFVVQSGCASPVTTQFVEVRPTPGPPQVTSNSPVCAGDSLLLDASGTGQSYQWTDPSGNVLSTTGPNLVLFPALPVYSGTFAVAQVLDGCPSNAPALIDIVVNDIPLDNAYAGEDILVCDGQSTTELQAEVTVLDGIWTTATDAIIVTPSDPNTVVTNLLPGQRYTFAWTVSNPGCGETSNDSVEIEVALPPDAVTDLFEVVENTDLENGDVLGNDTLYGRAIALTILNQVAAGDASVTLQQGIDYIPNPGYSGADSLLYQICLVTCPDMCDTAWVRFDIGPDLIVPDLITPNGDGTNDAFQIVGLENYPRNELYIYNRWGNEIYQAAPYQNNWEGTYRGDEVPDGTYFWVLLNGENGEDIARGYLTIHR
ncbi:MAG: gliding motility-associated C-terminal domain-containing protein, partial [Bacteroidota bacterium]